LSQISATGEQHESGVPFVLRHGQAFYLPFGNLDAVERGAAGPATLAFEAFSECSDYLSGGWQAESRHLDIIYPLMVFIRYSLDSMGAKFG
jgi:hypothetical protein